MRARQVVFRRWGEAGVLTMADVERAAPARGEVTVDVAFAGVNYADVLARRGFYKWAPPPGPGGTCVGFEIAGTVATTGEGVTGLAAGDRVMGVVRFGGYSDRVVVEAERLWKVPEAMSLEHAAAIPAVYMTAWQSLCEVARVRSGESILIQAVAGGVGIAALQLAIDLGLVTYGTASSPEKLAFAAGQGLHHGIDYAKLDFEAEIGRLTGGRGVDVVLDSLGGEALKKGYRALARCGRLVTIGAAQVAPTSRTSPLALVRAGVELLRGGVFHPFQLIEDNKTIAGVQVLLLWDDLPRLRRGMEWILAAWSRGAVRPHVGGVFPLEQAAEAHRLLESRRSKGKLLLRSSGG